jgi:prophage antirepressor-like protein
VSNVSEVLIRHVEECDRLKKTCVIKSNSYNDYTQAWFVNESGMYGLILGSKKPEARRFKHWVTSEVLPSIRKTGMYVEPVVGIFNGDMPGLLRQFASYIERQDKQIRELKASQALQEQRFSPMIEKMEWLQNQYAERLAALEKKFEVKTPDEGYKSAVRWSRYFGIKLDHGGSISVGKYAIGLYRRHYGKEPERFTQVYYGRAQSCALYPAKDKWMVYEALKYLGYI